MRIQLIRPLNDFVSPQVFNRMFTMHGTTMIFFVAMPMLFGFANYLMPLMIGARDMAFPRLNAFSFWMTAFGGFLLYFSFVGGDGLYGAGNAPDVGWFAYAPLTSQTFSPGHSTDYLDSVAAGFRLRQHRNSNQHHRHRSVHALQGNDPGKMPLFAWLNLVMAGMVMLAVSPLTAAQMMLLVDRYLGGHFFDTQAGGSAVLWMHFFWVFGHPEVYVLVIPRFCVRFGDHSGFLPQGDFRLPDHGGGNGRHRIHQHERVGPPHVHGRHEFGREQLFRPHHHGRRRSHGNQDLQLAGHHVGRKNSVQDADAVLHRISVPVPDRRSDRGYAGRRAFRLAAELVVFRGRALSLRHRGRHSIRALRGLLLLVPEDDRKNV